MTLQDKVAVVTGASMGIGLEIAHALAREGYQVVLAARSLEKLQQAAQACGPRAMAVPMDVTDDGSVKRAVTCIEQELGRVDVLVNNAGNGGSMRRWQDSSTLAVQAMFDTHVFGAERVMRAALPMMQRQAPATIVNISSTLGYVAMPGTAAYNAAKAAVVMLSRTLRSELRSQGIDVRVFSPPHTNTDSGQQMPLNLPKIFEPAWVAQEFVRFLKGRRPERLAGGNGSLLLLQRLSPRLASHVMQRIGFGALERVEARRLPSGASED